jgi:colanic acid biosynthesis glycosyl transferase WcaI
MCCGPSSQDRRKQRKKSNWHLKYARAHLRILVYGLNFAPEPVGIGKYTGEMVEWLSARGHEVRVVTAPPYYPQWKIRQDYKGKGYHREKFVHGTTVWRVPLWVPKKPRGFSRILHLASFALSSAPIAIVQTFWKPDIVFSVEPTFFAAPIALFAARLAGAKAWLHVQDFEVDAAFELGILPHQAASAALAIEESFMRRFDRVSTISAKMMEGLLHKGVAAKRAVSFPNWVDIEYLHPVEGESELRRTLGLSHKTVVLYSGNLGKKQGLELLAPLAQACEDVPDLHFIFCGEGAYREQLERDTARSTNVTLLPLQPIEKLNDLLNTADIHLLPQRAGAADLVMPSKLGGMLASGRPVIAMAHVGTQIATVLEGVGLIVPPEDVDELAAAVRLLATDPQRRIEMGRAAREYAVSHLGRDQILHQFEQVLRVLSGDASEQKWLDKVPVRNASAE